jgi:ribose 5-phosphate isomerase B
MGNKIVIAADHAGYKVKERVKGILQDLGLEYTDLGPDSEESVDYPDFARKVAEGVSSGEYDKGLLVCGTGIGMSIAANKLKGVRAAVAWNEESARLSRQHNDANVLAIGSRTTDEELVPEIVKAFFTTEFEGGRHQRRVDKITEIE